MDRVLAIATEQRCDLRRASRMIGIASKGCLIEVNAVNQKMAALNDPAAGGISGDQESPRLAGDLEDGFDFRSHIAAEDGVNLFVNPSGIGIQNSSGYFGDALGSCCR